MVFFLKDIATLLVLTVLLSQSKAFTRSTKLIDTTKSDWSHIRMSIVTSDVIESSSVAMAASIDLGTVVQDAVAAATKGGVAGASAAVVQVLSLMWLRTAINYQYKYGTNTVEAIATLYKSGGIPRLYAGFPFAILQGPLSRFGDTAANSLALSFWAAFDTTGTIPLAVKTAFASVLAGGWRIALTPIDSAKTILQVEGSSAGLDLLARRLKSEGASVLFNGALAASAATVVGHYPWFLVYNTLQDTIPTATALVVNDDYFPHFPLHISTLDPKFIDLLRSAFIGMCASSTSDVCSNSLRVVKTYRQSSNESLSYPDLVNRIIKEDGVVGLFGRGLQTRVLANVLQGMLFSVLYKYFKGS